MYFKRIQMFLFILMIFVLSCTKGKFPIENHLIIDNHYIDNWPDSLKTSSSAFPDTTLPKQQQRLSALRQTKINIFNNLTEMVYSLSISKIYTVQYLCLSDEVINDEILNYVKYSFKVTDTRYIFNGSIALAAFIKTEGVAQIIRNY